MVCTEHICVQYDMLKSKKYTPTIFYGRQTSRKLHRPGVLEITTRLYEFENLRDNLRKVCHEISIKLWGDCHDFYYISIGFSWDCLENDIRLLSEGCQIALILPSNILFEFHEFCMRLLQDYNEFTLILGYYDEITLILRYYDEINIKLPWNSIAISQYFVWIRALTFALVY